jgi:hypothetical protein
MIITQQMIRDCLYYKGPTTVLQLTRLLDMPDNQIFNVNRQLLALAKAGDAIAEYDVAGRKVWNIADSIRFLLDTSNRTLLG